MYALLRLRGREEEAGEAEGPEKEDGHSLTNRLTRSPSLARPRRSSGVGTAGGGGPRGVIRRRRETEIRYRSETAAQGTWDEEPDRHHDDFRADQGRRRSRLESARLESE